MHLLTRILALLLIPCLLGDVAAAPYAKPLSNKVSSAFTFQQQALIPVVATATFIGLAMNHDAFIRTYGWMLAMPLTAFFLNRPSSESENLIRIMTERLKVTDFLSKIPRAIAIFGSARIQPEDPAYELTVEVGREAFKAGVPVRTGAGPSIMEAGLKGWVEAREEVPNPLLSKTQGVRIHLSWENGFNEYVDEHQRLTCEHFVTRKLGLYRNSMGAIAMPGGIGTLDELMEVTQRGLPLVLMHPSKGDLANYWIPVMGGIRRAWLEGGFEKHRIPREPLITSDPQLAVAHILNAKAKKWPGAALSPDEANSELLRGWSSLEHNGHAAAVFIGRPRIDSPEFSFARELARQLLQRGMVIRGGTRGPLLNAILQAVNGSAEWRTLLQAVLFVPPGEELLPEVEQNFPTRVFTHDASNHQVLISKRGAAYVFFPGTITTGNVFFDLGQLMQTGKMDKRPMLLVGRSFWQTLLGPLIEMMLKKISTIHFPHSLITPGDENLFQIVDTPEEAVDIISKENGRKKSSIQDVTGSVFTDLLLSLSAIGGLLIPHAIAQTASLAVIAWLGVRWLAPTAVPISSFLRAA